MDYVTPTIERIQSASESLDTVSKNTSVTLEEMKDAEEEVEESTKDATLSIIDQNTAFTAQLTAVTSLHRGLTRLSSGLAELGLISSGTEQALRKISAVVGLVVGAFQLFKGVIYIVNALRQAELGLAAIETYRSILHRGPLGLALVGGAVAAAAGVGGYLLGQGSQTTNVSQNVTFTGYGTMSERATARETLRLAGA